MDEKNQSDGIRPWMAASQRVIQWKNAGNVWMMESIESHYQLGTEFAK